MIATAVLLALAGLLAPSALPGTTALVPSASAACPQVEVIFARGRVESPGVGVLGNAFINALRSKTDKNIGVYAVRYPADNEVDIGANDMSGHIQYMVGSCPDTRLVLGGYSLGAAVTDVVLAVPFDFFGFKNPLPPGADTHIAAVALFGNGVAWVGPIYELQPALPRQNHRVVPRRRPHLQPGRSEHLAGQLARPPRQRVYRCRHGESGGRFRRGP